MNLYKAINLELNKNVYCIKDIKMYLKILNLQLQLIKTPNKTKIFLVSAITAKSQGVGKDVVTNLSTSGSFSPPASPSNVLPIPSDGDLRNYRGSF